MKILFYALNWHIKIFIFSILIIFFLPKLVFADGFPNGPFGAPYKSDEISTYDNFLSQQQLVDELQKIVKQSKGSISLMSLNKYVNNVCNIGESCNVTFNNTTGPFDLRSVLKKDLLIVKVGTGPKIVIFSTGQHGNEDGPATGAVLKLLKKLNSNDNSSDLIKNAITLYVLVRMNPDGAEITDRGDGFPAHPRRCNSAPVTGSPSSCFLNASGTVRLGEDTNRWHYPVNIMGNGAPISDAAIYLRAPETLAFIQAYKTIRGVPNVNLPIGPGNNYTRDVAFLADWHGNGAFVTCPLVFDEIKNQYICQQGTDSKLVTVSMRPDAGAIGNPPTVPLNSPTPIKVMSSQVHMQSEQIVVALADSIKNDAQVSLSKYELTAIDGRPGYGRAATSYAYEGTPSMLYEVAFIRHSFNDNYGDDLLQPVTNIVYDSMNNLLNIIANGSYNNITNPHQNYLDNLPEATGVVGLNLRLPPYVASPSSFLENLVGFTSGNAEIVPLECACPFTEAFIRDTSLLTFDRCKKLQLIHPSTSPIAPPPFPYVGFPTTAASCPLVH